MLCKVLIVFVFKSCLSSLSKDPTSQSIFHLLWTSLLRKANILGEKKDLFLKGQIKCRISEKRRLFVRDPLFPSSWLFLARLTKKNLVSKKYIYDIFLLFHKVAVCALFLHFMIKSLENSLFCAFAKQSSPQKKYFFYVLEISTNIILSPYFSFQNVSFSNTSYPSSPSIFFHMWTGLWTLSCEKNLRRQSWE